MSPGKNLIEINPFQGSALPFTKPHIRLDNCSFEMLWPAQQMTQEMNGSASGCHLAGSGLTYAHTHLDCYPKVDGTLYSSDATPVLEINIRDSG